MAHKLDYDKFFGTAQNPEVIKKPVENDSVKGFLKELNESLSLANTTLSNFGIDPNILKQKFKEKIVGTQNRQEVQNVPYVETFRTPPKTAEITKQETKQEKMSINIDKIIKMIDLVLKFTKREDMTVQELKEFLTDNKELIEGIF